MNVAVTGGSGFIGGHLIEALKRRGDNIVVLSRGRRAPTAGVRVVAVDLTAPNAPLSEFVAGADVVYHCAGELRNTVVMKSLHVDGTRRLLDAAREEAERTRRHIHWVQLSSVGAYGPPAGPAHADRVVTEDTPTAPAGEYEITKTRADELVLECAAAGPLTASIVRPSNVIGADMPNASVRALASVIGRRLFFYPGAPGAIANYVHVDDVVDVLVRCGVDPRARGQTFNISSDCLLEEMVDAIAASLRVPRPTVRLPAAPLRILVGILSRVVRLPVTDGRINALVGRTRYPNAKLERVLEFMPRRAIPDVIGEVVAHSDQV